MLNQLILVGKIEKIEEKETSAKKAIAIITVAVPRSFKNANGEYDKDFIDCILWDNIATSTVKYCNKGDIIGVKGRLQKLTSDKELSIVAEKVTFLANKKNEE